MGTDSHTQVSGDKMIPPVAATTALVRQEAAYLRESLTTDRVFNIHAQCLLYRTKFNNTWWNLEAMNVLHSASRNFTVGVVFAYALVPRGWRRSMLCAGLIGSGIAGWALWRMFRLAQVLYDPRRSLPDHPPLEALEVAQRLTLYLDSTAPRPTPQKLLDSNKAELDRLKTIDKPTLYTPLPPDRVIRVLTVKPGDFDADIECTLGLSDICLPHEALSYTWGEERGMETITINGQPFDVRHNLSVALRYLRRKKQPRHIWVDAICINQDNPRERSDQVGMMSEIYGHAESVLVFLGDDKAMHVSELYDFFDALQTADDIDSALEQTDIPAVLGQFWPLLERPWWSRVWVVQEFVYSRRDPVFVCGHRQVKAGTFYKGIDLLRERMMADLYPRMSLPGESHPSLLDHSPVDHWHMLQMRRSLLHWRSMFHPVMYNISDLVKSTRVHHATDPRDKVFALQSLMMEPFRTAFAPDYNQDTATTYTRMASFLLCIQPWPELYNFFPIGNNPDLPSWVPDFSRGHGHDAHDQFWTLPLQMGAIGPMDCFISQGILTTRGIDCGKVTVIMDPVPDGGNYTLKPRGETALSVDEIKENILAIPTSLKGRNPNDPTDDFAEKYYEVFAGYRFDPNKTPFITREDVSDLAAAFSPESRHAIAMMLLRSSIIGSTGFSYDSRDNETIGHVENILKSNRGRRHRALQEAEESRIARMEQKATRERLQLGKIEEDLEIDRAEYLKSAEQVARAADEFQRRIYTHQSERVGKASMSAFLHHSMIGTDSGLVGLASGIVEDGDRLVLLHGVASLFIARAVGDDGLYSLAGRAVISEGMAEKLREAIEDGSFPERDMSFQ